MVFGVTLAGLKLRLMVIVKEVTDGKKTCCRSVSAGAGVCASDSNGQDLML